LRRAVVAGALVALGVVVAVVAVRARHQDDAGQFDNSCAASGIEVPKPPELPSTFPLPPGTRFTLSSVSAAGAVLASAYVPLSFPEAVQFFQAEPARAGYRPFGAKESEGTGRAGAEFRGRGRTGRWTLDELPGCTSAVVLTLRFRP
jgi:hypothetical protein